MHETELYPAKDYRLYDEADLTCVQCIREIIHEEGYLRRPFARDPDGIVVRGSAHEISRSRRMEEGIYQFNQDLTEEYYL